VRTSLARSVPDLRPDAVACGDLARHSCTRAAMRSRSAASQNRSEADVRASPQHLARHSTLQAHGDMHSYNADRRYMRQKLDRRRTDAALVQALDGLQESRELRW